MIWQILLNIFRTEPLKDHLFAALKDIWQEMLKEDIQCSKTLNYKNS